MVLRFLAWASIMIFNIAEQAILYVTYFACLLIVGTKIYCNSMIFYI